MTTEDIVRNFILEQVYVADSAELTVDASLIDTGIVDSMGMLDVILFLETRMGISISDSDTIPENLETIGRIAAFVERRRMSGNGTDRHRRALRRGVCVRVPSRARRLRPSFGRSGLPRATRCRPAPMRQRPGPTMTTSQILAGIRGNGVSREFIGPASEWASSRDDHD